MALLFVYLDIEKDVLVHTDELQVNEGENSRYLRLSA